MDTLNDLYLNQNRDIEMTDQNDLRLTHGIQTVEQSLGISLGGEAQSLIGEQLTGSQVRSFIDSVESEVDRDPQIESLDFIELQTINKQNNTLTMTLRTTANNEFEVTL